MLKDVVIGKKMAIALCQGFMGNTALFDIHILLAGARQQTSRNQLAQASHLSPYISYLTV